MRNIKRLLLACLLAVVSLDCVAVPQPVVVNDFGDAGPGDCTTTCTLRDAIGVALAAIPIRPVIFSVDAVWPQTITLAQGELYLNNTSASTLSVAGPGATKLAISANNSSRVLQVNAGSIQISDLTLRDGKVVGVSPDPQVVFGSTGQDGGAASGGCIVLQATATLTLERSDVRNCVALGGTGGIGGAGTFGGGLGGAGGKGGTILGGCIGVLGDATMALDQVDVRNCAGSGGKGGKGGNGGDGSPGRGGNGATGGGGAQASGGAIYTAGNLTLLRSSVVLSSATAGDGGVGGFGGKGGGVSPDGNGGSGGPGGLAAGGAVYIASSGGAVIRNTTLAEDIAAGGAGGNGTSGNVGGNGGAGGQALGGLLRSEDPSGVVDVEFTTLANGAAIPGSGGSAGSGSPDGIPGTSGEAHGAAINAGGPVMIQSALVVGVASVALCSGNVDVAPGAANLDQDSSCPGFMLHGAFAQTLLPLSLAATSSPGYTPAYQGAAIDASASCTQIGGVIVVLDDQHRTPRPQGVACDLGAIESDYLFVGTFD